MKKEKTSEANLRKSDFRGNLFTAIIMLVLVVVVVGICTAFIHKGLEDNHISENIIQKYISNENEERYLDPEVEPNAPDIYEFSCKKAGKAIVEFEKLQEDGTWEAIAEKELDLSGLESGYLSIAEQDGIIAISTEPASVESSESDSIKKNVNHIEFQSKTASTCVYLQREKIELGKEIILQLWTDEPLYCVNNKVSLQQTYKKLQSKPNGNSSCIIIRFE